MEQLGCAQLFRIPLQRVKSGFMWKWRYKESNRILTGAALKAHSLQTGVLNATYRFRQVDMFESDEVQTDIFYEQVSELQACRVTKASILSAGRGKQKGATQQAQRRVGGIRREAASWWPLG